MIALFCFFLALFASPLKSKSRLEAENAALRHQLIILRREVRSLAERCIRLAKECTKPRVAEYLMTLAANYLELAERALILREPATAVRRQHIKAVQRE
jgi:hypothetical protein